MAQQHRILVGDCIDMMRTLPDQSVHTCITSPPYFGLRDYGVDGQIGLEASPREFIDRLVAVFREVRRVLRDDGTAWVNMGDSYAGSWGAHGRDDMGLGGQSLSARQVAASARRLKKPNHHGFKPKDLLGLPWRLAVALQDDGWYLRQDIIWHKPNPMPESIKDRCTKAHEYVFLLSKDPRYYFDQAAIREPARAQVAPESAASATASPGRPSTPKASTVRQASTGQNVMTSCTTRPGTNAAFGRWPPPASRAPTSPPSRPT
ncbi:DNA-methyltransferase [Pseudomonas alabamensis]|uniref:DNA-methyltransferase n=1 Tax=Pseudomonas alabamensis TaxID=3064349 RepID=UPI003988431B